MIIFDKVLIKGYDGKIYELNFHIPTPSITLIIAPSMIDQEELAKYILKYKEPSSGRVIHDFKTSGRNYGLYLPEYVLSSENIKVYEILTKILNKDDFYYIVRLCKNIGIDVDHDTLLSELPLSIRALITMLTIFKLCNELYVLIEPFYSLDATLISILNTEIFNKRLKRETIIMLTTNKAAIDLMDFEYVVIIDREGKIVEGEKKKLKQKEPWGTCHIYELMTSKELIGKIMFEPGFRGFMEIEKNIYWIFIDPKYTPHYVSILRKYTRERLIKRIKRIEKK